MIFLTDELIARINSFSSEIWVQAGVAQLARASRCHREGRGFESPFPLQTHSLVQSGVVIANLKTLARWTPKLFSFSIWNVI
jgi:hypothetical protein